jgi:uncharacterized protein (TIGR00290 family)
VSGVALSWSGGKDSALALWAMREEQGIEPAALLTTFTEDYGRVSMHAVRRELLEAQAAAVGVPLVEVGIPAVCSNEVYEERMAAALAAPPLAEVDEFAFADLFLADIRTYREERLAAIGRRASFPIWGRETGALAERFVEAGFAATLVCVDPKQLDASFCGRAFDAGLLRDLPASVDPCGENGEFHTFVTAGPVFSSPVPIEHGETVERDGFVFHDLLLGGPT